MKNLWKKAAMMAVFGLMGSLAVAQTHNATFKVPFSFHAGDQFVPAGEYRTEVDVIKQCVTLFSADGRVAMRKLTRTAQAGEAKALPTLVFEKHGNAHFLRQVRMAHSRNSQELPRSQAEREMAKTKAASVEMIAGS